MSPRPLRRTSLALGTAALALPLVLAGCGGSSTPASSTQNSSTSATPTETTPASASAGAGSGGDLAALVPDAIKKDGKVVVGTDATYAPSEFLDADGKTVKGFDVDVFNAVVAKLGLKAEFTPAPFGAIITGVTSGKYEIGVSSFTINPERKQQALMVSYYTAGTAWATAKGNPDGIDPEAACGKRIAVQKDTVQVGDIQARDKKCKDAGKPGITIDQYQGQDQATAAVVSNKDSAMLADYPVIVYAVSQTGGKLEQLGKQYEAAPYGYVVAKDQTKFADALIGGLKAIIADGSYKQILTKWGVDEGAITEPQLNP